MPAPIPCPNCRSPIGVPAGHAKPTVRCGICWHEVPVDVPTLRPAAAPTVAVAVPAKSNAGVRVAVALPAGAKPAAGMAPLEALIHKAAAKLPGAAAPPPVPPPAPVVAAVVQPAPVERPPPTVVPTLPRAVASRSKFARRDDDDEDDRPARRRGRRTGSNALYGAIAAGVTFLILLLVGTVYLIKWATADNPVAKADPPANQPIPNDNRPRPNANPLPAFVPPPDPPPGNRPDPRRPFPDPEWRPVAADGFAFEVPGDARPVPHREWLFGPNDDWLQGDGKKYTVHGPWFTVEARWSDAPAGTTPTLAKVITYPGGTADQTAPCKLAGHAGVEWVQVRGGWTTTIRAVQVGCRVFVFKAEGRPVFGRTPEDAEALTKKFFDSMAITFDPATPPPAASGRRAGAAGLGFDPFAGPEPPPAVVARIDPFLCGVVLADRGEVFTIGFRPGSRQQGVLRRYTYPGFVPKNTFHLPAAATYAAVHPGTGKLVLATVAKASDAPARETDRVIVAGDVQAFDLLPVFAGKVPERDELKPTASVPFYGAKLAGLELSPDGASAFVLSLHNTSVRTKPWRAKLTKIDVATGRPAAELDLPDPAWRLRSSPDGRTLYAAEVLVDPAGRPTPGLARTANVLAIDVAGWRPSRTLTAPGTVFDFAVAADGTVVAAVTQPNGFRAFALPADGRTLDLTPADGRSAALGHVMLANDGKRLVTSAMAGQGVEVFDVANLTAASGLSRTLGARQVRGANPAEPAVPVGGAFVLTADGRYAVLQAGVVLDVTNPGTRD